MKAYYLPNLPGLGDLDWDFITIQLLKNLSIPKITNITVDDVRFPTSKDLTGSDAVHTDPIILLYM